MTERRFKAGDTFLLNGLTLRVAKGYKGDDDLRLEFRVRGAWRAVPMAAGFLMADFFAENEDVLYRGRGVGGRFYLDRCEKAVERGWEWAQQVLEEEQSAKRERRTV